jgi:DNA-binding transcriptional MerR regulator
MELGNKTRGFEGRMVEVITDISQRRRIDWAERRLVVPEIEETIGRGSRRVYSYWNLVQIAMIKKLSNWGLSLSRISNILSGLEYYKKEDYSKTLKGMVGLIETTSDNNWKEIVKQRIKEFSTEERAFKEKFPSMEIIGIFFSKTRNQIFISEFGEDIKKLWHGEDKFLGTSFEEKLKNSEGVLVINFQAIKKQIDTAIETLGL